MHFFFLFNKILGKYFIWLAMKLYISPEYSMTNRFSGSDFPIVMIFFTFLFHNHFNFSFIFCNRRRNSNQNNFIHILASWAICFFVVVAISSKIKKVSKIFLSFYLHPKFKLMISLIFAWLIMNIDKKTNSPVEWTKLLRCIINQALRYNFKAAYRKWFDVEKSFYW